MLLISLFCSTGFTIFILIHLFRVVLVTPDDCDRYRNDILLLYPYYSIHTLYSAKIALSRSHPYEGDDKLQIISLLHSWMLLYCIIGFRISTSIYLYRAVLVASDDCDRYYINAILSSFPYHSIHKSWSATIALLDLVITLKMDAATALDFILYTSDVLYQWIEQLAYLLKMLFHYTHTYVKLTEIW